MLDSGNTSRRVYTSPHIRRRESSTSISSTTSTCISTDSESIKKPDKIFQDRIPQIVQRWLRNELLAEDYSFVHAYQVDLEEYLGITDRYNIGRGVELVDGRIKFDAVPTQIHEVSAMRIHNHIIFSYGPDALVPLGSATMVYDGSKNAKQPDQSYRPPLLPKPTRANGVKLQPSGNPFPTLVVEIAVRNEDRERLLEDACRKYFSEHTSVKCWIGIKVKTTPAGGEQFWVGWGRRKLGGKGLKLEQPTEDDSGEASFKNVHLPAGTSHPGQLTIPSTLIFEPTAVPVGSPPELTLKYETVRKWLVDALKSGIA